MPSSSQRPVRIKPLSAGVKLDRHPTLIGDGQSPSAKNVEFSNDSIRAARGSRKLGNQNAPRPALRCAPDPAYSPLYVEAGKSVPLRGYATWGYDAALDIGGVRATSGAFPSETYHNQRGRSFELQLSFRLPETFRIHDRPARGEGVPASENAAIAAGCGYDEGLDDCTILVQKGGDRQTPMSWAIGVVNAGKHVYSVGLTDPAARARKSNLFLVFMWLDAPEWGVPDRTKMRYDLATFANNATGQYCTTALRAVILDGRDDAQVNYSLEPGRNYNLSLAVTLDSLTGGTTWAHNGRVDMRLQEEFGRLFQGSFVDSAGGGTATSLSVWKGPQDSLRYLAKFGLRYVGADAVHFGLGYRTAPWEALGWIPYGHDSSSMETKGFRMADMTLNSTTDLYGALGYDLTCTHPVAGNTYLSVNAHRGLTEGGATGGPWARSPLGPRNANWQGYGGPIDDTGAPATNFNPEALRGYRVVFPRSADATMNALRGGRMNIESYSEVGVNDYRLEVQDAENLGVTWATEQPFLICAFRWNQQPVVLQEFRLWSSSRDYTNPRVAWSMAHSLDLDDDTEPELQKLQALIPFDDAGGRTCRELVGGKSAYLAPCSLALDARGQEGEQALFLSGEGDALVYDLSENPVFAREMRAMLQSQGKGLAIELSCILPEAHYGIATNDPAGSRSTEYEAAYCPDLVSWAVKAADESGSPSSAAPLLVMGHHSWWSTATGTTPERKPQGFHVDYHAGLDSDNPVMTRGIVGFTRSAGGPGNWDDTAPWVGKRITIQVGIQPSPANRAGTAGKAAEYRLYIAATPKGSLKYAAGENPQAEFAYFSDVTIQRKELPRLVVTIGGGWNPSLARGYTEYGARLLVDKVRVYGATAAGELPVTTGLVTSENRGKILGRNSLAQRELSAEDILQPVGPGTVTARLTEASATVQASGPTAFFTQLPESSSRSVREKYLVARGDAFLLPSTDLVKEFIQEFYWISSVAADGSTLTLATPFAAPSSVHGSAACTNLVGYTVFDRTAEDLLRSPLSLGSGAAYRPGTTKTKDIALSEELFENRSPVTGKWRVRVASPFTAGGLATVLPSWGRGIVSPRRSPITGLFARDGDVLAVVRGAVHEVDDRWREDGPTPTLTRSLGFRGKKVEDFEHAFQLAGDGVRFSNCSNAWPYWNTTLARNFTWVYDFWVYLDEYAEYETLMWLGCEYSHLLLGPGNSDNLRGIGIWVRLASGRPEVVRESAGAFAGGATTTPDGRYTATAADRIPLRRWTHVRLWLSHVLSGGLDVVQTPAFSINGRRSSVTVNATETGLAAGEWIKNQNGGGLIGSVGDTRNVLYLGVARDAVRTYAKSQFTAVNQLGGREFPGSRITGRLHPLLGRMAGAVVWRAASADVSVAGYPDFDPFSVSYSGKLVRFRADLQEGVGHKVDDAASETEVTTPATVPGVVLSHPFIDRFNELGLSEQSPSFAADGERVYVTNGGRPAFVSEDGAGFAGILPPSSAPTVTVERKPLWEPNNAPIGSSSGDQDPIAQAAAGAGQQLFHYSSFGNNFMRQRWHEDMRWTKDDSAANTPFDILTLKCYWSPREVAGRIPLWSSRISLDSGGPFLECVDGKARVGWYDTALKKAVYVETSCAVFRPGYWYYIYLRKAFPMQDAQEGNWLNSYFSTGLRRRAAFTITAGTWAVGDLVRNGGSTKRGVVTKVYAGRIEYLRFQADADFIAAEAVNNGAGATGTIDATPHHMTGDSLVIREFSKTGTMLDTVLWGVKSGSHRNAVSFTSAMPRSPNTTAIGQVTPKGVLYSGTAGGQVQVGTMLGVAAPAWVFHPDMIGMQWQFSSTSANAPEKVYRIASVPSQTVANVVDENGNSPNLSAITNREGGVFAGAELVKSADFDNSKTPDQGNYDIEWMGSSLAADPATGIARMSGKFASFSWGIASSLVSNSAFYSGINPFETATPTELGEVGTDVFSQPIYNTTTSSEASRPDELHVDSGKCFTCIDTQPYVGAAAKSTQPNAALAVAQDTEASANAESLYWNALVDRETSFGRRRVRVIFYDRDQDARSNPSPEVIVQPDAEDETNPSGIVRLLVTNLPISHQRGNIERWVYVSEPDEFELFRQVIVPDNASSSAALELDDDSMDFSEILDYDNPAPPDCSVLGLSQSTMFYADIRLAGRRRGDMVRFSKPFLPLSVPYENTLTLISGRSERITALADVGGELLVWKRDSLHGVTLREAAASQRTISPNVGAPGPQAVAVIDGEVYWCSTDRGPYAYVGGGGPLWLGENVQPLFDGEATDWNVETRDIARAVLAVNRRQDQLVLALRGLGELDARRRLSIEYDDGLSGAGVGESNGFRYALYEGPNITALAGADRETAGAQRFLGGTSDGFVVDLDRADTQLELAGSNVELSHPTQVTLGVGSTTSKLVLSGATAYLTELEGVRGVTLSWLEGTVERRAVALFSDGNSIWLDRALAAAPASETVVSLSAIPIDWRSKWFDFGSSETRKVTHYIDFVLVKQSSGTALLEVYVDFETTPAQLALDTGLTTQVSIDLTKPLQRVPLGELRGQFFQFRFRSLAPGVALEITELVVRAQEVELH